MGSPRGDSGKKCGAFLPRSLYCSASEAVPFQDTATCWEATELFQRLHPILQLVPGSKDELRLDCPNKEHLHATEAETP